MTPPLVCPVKHVTSDNVQTMRCSTVGRVYLLRKTGKYSIDYAMLKISNPNTYRSCSYYGRVAELLNSSSSSSSSSEFFIRHSCLGMYQQPGSTIQNRAFIYGAQYTARHLNYEAQYTAIRSTIHSQTPYL